MNEDTIPENGFEKIKKKTTKGNTYIKTEITELERCHTQSRRTSKKTVDDELWEERDTWGG
jgi:hypothetical protein